MKKILNSLQEVAVARIRNPILGTFILSWSVLNIKGLVLFLFIPVSEKIMLIRNWEPIYTHDLLYPLGLTIGYLAILPFFQIAHQYLEEGVFEPIKYKIKHQNLRNYYKGMRDVNEYKADSDEGRIVKLKEANVLNWPDEKKRISAIALNHKLDISKKIKEMHEIAQKVEPALEQSYMQSQAYEQYVVRLSMIKGVLANATFKDSNSIELVDNLDLIIKDLQAINKGEFNKAGRLYNTHIGNGSKMGIDFEEQFSKFLLTKKKELAELDLPKRVKQANNLSIDDLAELQVQPTQS
ncbi:hypothetical protein O4H50_05165 [Vibrio diazotrophicus]|uniref:hypothetical protein n=1 Tax=Vibrio diazotrophicus TaxID=685 RepID=UPI0022AF92E0|nr:hypothetical protein [Vibrio diazotrophicus]MCZ4371172.1 hypothetical protein [Vibrio diazotrophicus]